MPDAGTCVFVTALCYALTRPLPSPCTHLWGQALALPGPAGQGNVGGDSEVGSVRVCVLVDFDWRGGEVKSAGWGFDALSHHAVSSQGGRTLSSANMFQNVIVRKPFLSKVEYSKLICM